MAPDRSEEKKGYSEQDIEELRRVIKNSYAPYSGVRVAALVESASGRKYFGVNVENASYGLTICAERSAVAAMVAAGDRRIRRVVILSNTEEPLPPCGACRQVLAEFDPEGSSEVVSISLSTGRTARWKLSELLPFSRLPIKRSD